MQGVHCCSALNTADSEQSQPALSLRDVSNYFRSYDPSTGTYLESDPIGLNEGLNTYGYVAGNPLSAIDPFGLDLILVGEPGGLGHILNLAAQTYDAENCGCNEIVEVGLSGMLRA